jgi:nitronate monooxygenase/enoyl-[acyl-carrier protein] reductase II
VDVIVAQGSEAGGNCGIVASSVLVPQVADAVAPLPVVAAGGIADGRGLAAALVLGAAGANIGTRFLASAEATVAEEWKQRIVKAVSEEAVRLTFWPQIFGTPPGAYDVAPRALRTPFADEWLARPQEAGKEAMRLRGEIVTALQGGTVHETSPFTGQAAGLVHDVLPAAEIVRRIAAGAEEALQRVAAAART